MSKRSKALEGKFGRLTIVKRIDITGKPDSYMCKCVCGTIKQVHRQELVKGDTKSCGCLRKEVSRRALRAHGQTKSPIHNIWIGMRDRCNNTNSKAYKHYGGRGITVCKRWDKFETFLKDMGPRPDNKSLERKNNNLGYSPENCIWASAHQQTRNTRRNINITYKNQTMCVQDWALKLNLNAQTLYTRIKQGRPVDQIFSVIRLKKQK